MSNICRPGDSRTGSFMYAFDHRIPVICIDRKGHFWNRRYLVFWNTDPSKLKFSDEDNEYFVYKIQSMVDHYADNGDRMYDSSKMSGDVRYGFTDYVTHLGAEVIAQWIDMYYLGRVNP